VTDRQARPNKTFSFDEAAALVPEVRRLTDEALRRLETLRGAAESAPGPAEALDGEATAVVDAWAARMRALGADVKGLWLVDFDNGSGYYCWRWPEPGLLFYHSYQDGFAGRMRIQ
jgi:hypothetical protein